MSRRNRYHHAASSSASGSGFSTPTATAAAPQILQPSAYHQPQQSRQQNFYSGNGGGAGVTSSSSSAAHRSTSPFQRPNSSANFQAGAAGGVPERYTESPFGGGGGTRAGGVDRTAHQLEGQNNERLEGLLGKVKLLKDITVGIGDEVRQSNMELGDMNDTFSSTSAFLSGTFNRMKSMAKRQGGHWCWFMAFLGLVFWIFVILWVIRR